MMKKEKGKLLAILGTLIIHLLVFFIAWWYLISAPKLVTEMGVPVMMGNVDFASGVFDPGAETAIITNESQSETKEEQPLISQTDELSAPTLPKNRKKSPQNPPSTTIAKQKEAQKREQAANEKRDKAISDRVNKAFGTGAQAGNKGISSAGEGVEGSKTGNDTAGAGKNPGYGEVDLGGRKLRNGILPKPTYTVRDEGKVVVNITVNPAGEVIATTINRNTNTINSILRKAAEVAAKKALFQPSQGDTNQQGTISYRFVLK